MLTTFRTSDAQLEAVERVRAWTRNRFRLGDEAPVFVSEVTCALPGCPPLETVVGFWTADGMRRHFKVFKPVLDVLEDDLPFAWLIDALAVAGDAGCEC